MKNNVHVHGFYIKLIFHIFNHVFQLAVSPVIAIENQSEPGWGDWPNQTKDDRLMYLEHLISEKYTFNKAMWPGGVTTEPLLKNPKARGHRHGN